MATPPDRTRRASAARPAAASRPKAKGTPAPAKPKSSRRSRAKREPAAALPPAAPPATARIIVFSCQWAPHYAFQSLYRRGRRGEGDGVRFLTACLGRIGEDLVLEAFRLGADGVAVLSCPRELCRHGLDHGIFQARLASLRAILATLGVPAGHLLVAAYHPHEGERLADEIAAFAVRVGADIGADRAPAALQEGL